MMMMIIIIIMMVTMMVKIATSLTTTNFLQHKSAQAMSELCALCHCGHVGADGLLHFYFDRVGITFSFSLLVDLNYSLTITEGNPSIWRKSLLMS